VDSAHSAFFAAIGRDTVRQWMERRAHQRPVITCCSSAEAIKTGRPLLPGESASQGRRRR
jgi:hypothetical protein